MVNPLFSSRRSIAIYVLPWIILILLHGSLLFYNFHLDLAIAFGEAFIFNVVFAVMGTGLWYIVQYNAFSRNHLFHNLVHQLGICLIFIALWYSVSIFLVSIVFPMQSYHEFIENTFTWRISFGISIYVALLLAFYSYKFNDSLKEKEMQHVHLQNYLREAELRSLKSQLNPHFIFNSLNSINALTVSAPEKAREMVVKLSEFLRYSLKKQNETDMAKLSEELENARRYLDIEKVRFGKNLVYQEEIKEECLKVNVPNYVLQPLLENAIKHGVYESFEPVVIHFKCEIVGEFLVLSLSNNFEKDGKVRKGEGIGLKNIRNRLKLIYGMENLMSIQEKDQQFKVTISIPTSYVLKS